MNWETGTDMYTLLTLCIKQITNEDLLFSSICSDLNGKEIQERGHICEHIADSLCVQQKLTQLCKATILQ